MEATWVYALYVRLMLRIYKNTDIIGLNLNNESKLRLIQLLSKGFKVYENFPFA